jgi:hypothetical protein
MTTQCVFSEVAIKFPLSIILKETSGFRQTIGLSVRPLDCQAVTVVYAKQNASTIGISYLFASVPDSCPQDGTDW